MTNKKEIEDIVKTQMREYEERYRIQVILWTIRGSVDIGIHRKNSDLDIIFIYRSKEKNIKAIHDIVGHGFDYWGWLLDDVITMVNESNLICDKGITYYISSEHERGSLDYYFGLYCAIDNECSYICEWVDVKIIECIRKLFVVKSCIVWMNSKLEKIYRMICEGGSISGNTYLYGVWYVLMSKQILNGNRPGNNKFVLLLDEYIEDKDKQIIYKIYEDYIYSNSKNSNVYKNNFIDSLIMEQYDINRKYICESEPVFLSEQYKVAIEKIREFAD